MTIAKTTSSITNSNHQCVSLEPPLNSVYFASKEPDFLTIFCS